MPDHVAVGIVEDDHVVFPAFDPLDHLVGDDVGAHLRLHVIGRNLGRGDQRAVLARVGLLDAAVEKEGDVRVLLRFRNPQLGEALVGDVLAEGVVEALRLEGHLDVRHRHIVLGHADEEDVLLAALALKALEVRVHEGPGQFARAVGTEVVEDHRIAVADTRVLEADGRLDEFIGDLRAVGFLRRVDRRGVEVALPLHDRVIGAGDALPAVVAVHRVIPADHRRDAADADPVHLGFQLREKIHARGRGHVAAVHEAVDVHLLEPRILRQPQQAVKVGVVAVHAAVRAEAHQVQRGVVLFAVLHRRQQSGVLKEVPVLDRLGDAGQLLIDDAARADVGVAHLAVGQAHVEAGRPDQRVGAGGHQAVDIRLFGRRDRVAVVLRVISKTVQDNECQRFFHLLSS